MLFKGSQPNSFVALTELKDKNGNDVIVAVHINNKMNRTIINRIASLYSKSDNFGNNHIENYVKQQIEQGNLLDASIIKAPNWFTSKGLQLPKLVQTILNANSSISSSTEKSNNKNEKNSYALGSEDYDKPITADDIQTLKEMFPQRKSISGFTEDEVRATAKWAYKYYQQMGTKSPFFRRWFGEWRAYDITPVNVAKQQGQTRGNVKNIDTEWNISVSGKVFNESKAHQGNKNKYAVPYLAYINDIVKNAVLFDSITSDKGGNSLFYHSLYAIADTGNGTELLKLLVEEMYDPNIKDDTHRAYQLQDIEKKQFGVKGSQSNSVSLITQTASAKNIADLYTLVKQYDKRRTGDG